VTARPLGLDDDQLVACVACGLCLPHCPTYRVTGLEFASPRGRIAAMRAVESGRAPIDDEFLRAMNECVQCRGCEAACPSSVPFGALMETTRAALHQVDARPRWRRAFEWVAYRAVLPSHVLLVVASWLLLVAQRLRLVPRRLAVPSLSARSLTRRLDLPRGGSPDAWLFTGCVMHAWMSETHHATARVMRASGASSVACPARGGDCCGALHVHAGRRDEARRLAGRVLASMPGDAPVVVNSAGCGAAMKDYGELLGTAEAARFAARVRDFSEWTVEQGVPRVEPTGRVVVVQDPCHLRHVQKAHLAVRALLRDAYELVELDDDGLCCGAGGAYAATEPELATAVRDRKVDAIRRAGGDHAIVASANPGCLMHLRSAGLDVRHPADLLADALGDA
jgi:glycolate oxidase iron-sulfur subunit